MSRRDFLAAGGLAAGGALIAGCGSSNADNSRDLVFSTPTDAVATIALFKKFAAQFERTNAGSSVDVILNGGGSFDLWLQTHLAAHKAPDVLRITPTQIGRYIGNGGMIDITKYLPDGYGDDFNPTFWSQVSAGGGVYGIPQCVDTTALYYRKPMLEKVGARIPKSPADAWRWDEFISICKEVKKLTGKYAFSYQWSTGAGYYWLPILYQHGGSLVEDDLTTPAINNDAGIEALEWTRRWFTDGLISPSNSIQGTVGDAAINLFTAGQVGMMVNGDWKLTNVQSGGLKDDEWDVTYLFRDTATASLVGGTIIGVTRDARDPELSAALAQAMCSEASMRTYCAQTLFLPARDSLIGKGTTYAYRPEAVQRFVEQSAATPKKIFELQTSKNFSSINDSLSNEIALCFTGQQSAKDTASAISSAIKNAAF